MLREMRCASLLRDKLQGALAGVSMCFSVEEYNAAAFVVDDDDAIERPAWNKVGAADGKRSSQKNVEAEIPHRVLEINQALQRGDLPKARLLAWTCGPNWRLPCAGGWSAAHSSGARRCIWSGWTRSTGGAAAACLLGSDVTPCRRSTWPGLFPGTWPRCRKPAEHRGQAAFSCTPRPYPGEGLGVRANNGIKLDILMFA